MRGAFGTGKTTTLCQVVVQLLRAPRGAGRPCRILLCTECNAAADLYISLLCEAGLTTDELLRCYQVRIAPSDGPRPSPGPRPSLGPHPVQRRRRTATMAQAEASALAICGILQVGYHSRGLHPSPHLIQMDWLFPPP